MKIRNQFPLLKTDPKLVYLDSGATALKPQMVIDAEQQFLMKNGTSPHSLTHRHGYATNELVEGTRKAAASLINASQADEIVFTSGTTAALNQVAFGLVNQIQPGDEIWLTTLEHGSNLLPWIEVAKQTKADLKFLPLTKTGLIDVSALPKLLSKKTKIVTFAHSSNTLGGFNDVAKITKITHQANSQSLVILDAAQTIAHIPIDVQKWDLDFLAFSGHKMYGPFGIGVLWGRLDLLKTLTPLMFGGGMNISIDPETKSYVPMPLPARLEAGTGNISAIIGLKAAIQFLEKIGFVEIQKHEKALKDYFAQQVKLHNLTKEVDFYNLETEGPLILFNAKKWQAQDVATFLDVRYNIAVRDGEHCARLTNRYLGINTTVRASLGIYNNFADLDRLVEALKNIDKALEIF
ncbi:cysteine desulfurase/selenocysteine lyase [Entomoplasma freundtii]|uniref:cysteine desulfurase n=1 Tax=Entomoplasma freundtii TaxID=74700 RepID=A0A2K8NUU1_9MOLU|nr:cysteine desulfurase [Entomoplasma freundtii]ATZ16531.1 cysteine desulfurase [Entomoplasma freundtii]TDY58303.1 cysteine desulfurase/selenocysteine lyase [Entomoplasma freundtii]